MITLRHAAKVACADLSADGRVAITSDVDQRVHVWRVAQPSAPVRTFELEGKSFACPVAISADGTMVALAPITPGESGYGSKPVPSVVRVASVETGEVLRELAVDGRPQALRFFADGTLVVGAMKRGLWLFPPDGGAPFSLGNKTLDVQAIQGTRERLCVRVSHWEVLPWGAAGKPKKVKARAADCNGDTLVLAPWAGSGITRVRGKSEAQVVTPSKVCALALSGDRVVVVCEKGVYTCGLEDLTLQAVAEGDFAAVGDLRIAGDRAILWGLPQLQGSLAVATLIELDTSAEVAKAAHASDVVDLAWLDAARLVSTDERGTSIVWPEDGEPRALRDLTETLPARFRARLGVDSPFPGPVAEALEHGGGLLGALNGRVDFATAEGDVVRVLVRMSLPARPGCLHRIDDDRALLVTGQLVVLAGVPPQPHGSGPYGGMERLVVSQDGSFAVRLSGSGFSIHPTRWLDTMFMGGSLGAPAADVALAADDALVVAVGDTVQVVDLGTGAVRISLPLGKPIQRIALLETSDGARVGAAFRDGTTARVDVPAYEPVTRLGPRISEAWDRPLASVVQEEFARLGFRGKVEAPSVVETRIGPCPLPRHLRELFEVGRPVLAPHGSSPGVWNDLVLEDFYAPIWKAKKVAKANRRIDIGTVRFATTPRVVEIGASFNIELAAAGDGVLWVASLATQASTTDDPFVTFFHPETGVSGGITYLSELLYRLAPGSRHSP